jgi:RNA polymerase sigma factor (TIGR02999 family)
MLISPTALPARQPMMDPAAPGFDRSRRWTMDDSRPDVTRILQDSEEPSEELYPLVYEELRIIAQNRMRAERSGHTLQATALVHEAYMRLVRDDEISWRSRRHFYGAAAEAMRRILVDHARKANSEKRGGSAKRVTLGTPESPMAMEPDQVLALDEALDKLEAEDPRAAAVTRLRFLSGLSVEETARTLEVSERSVFREWTYARARLFDLLSEADS